MAVNKIDEIITHTDTAWVRNIVQNRLIISLVFVTFGVLSCSRELPADPMCRMSELSSESEPSPAACLIKSHGKLLAIKSHNDDRWDLPSQKQHNSTSAQCTAHKAVWKTTGLNVEVGQLLFTAQKQTQYFECRLTDDFSRQLEQFPVPSWADRKTSSIALIDPFETHQEQWVSDINLSNLREVYNQLE